MTTVYLVLAGLAVIGILAGLLIRQSRKRGRDAANLKGRETADEARKRMDKVDSAGKPGTVDKLRDGRF